MHGCQQSRVTWERENGCLGLAPNYFTFKGAWGGVGRGNGELQGRGGAGRGNGELQRAPTGSTWVRHLRVADARVRVAVTELDR